MDEHPSPFDDRSWADGLTREQLIKRVEGWVRTAQTSEREIAWLRRALGIADTLESCAVRDLIEATEEPTPAHAKALQAGLLNPDEWDYREVARVLIRTSGAIWLEQMWREHAEMWERRCSEATAANVERDQELKRLRRRVGFLNAGGDPNYVCGAAYCDDPACRMHGPWRDDD